MKCSYFPLGENNCKYHLPKNCPGQKIGKYSTYRKVKVAAIDKNMIASALKQAKALEELSKKASELATKEEIRELQKSIDELKELIANRP